MGGGSSKVEDVDAGYDKFKKRAPCRDCLCIPLFGGCLGALLLLFYLTVNDEPELFDKLMYPQDVHKQYCGKSGTAVSDRHSALYPQLDQDIISHFGAAATSFSFEKMVTFVPTTLCVSSCPETLTLNVADRTYGGASYPNDKDDDSTDTWIFSMRTQDIYKRCLPTEDSYEVSNRELCVSPNCTAAQAMTGLGTVTCSADLPATTDVDNVWEVCPDGAASSVCNARAAACSYKVEERQAATYAFPGDETDSTTAFSEQFASFLTATMAAYDACIKGMWTIIVLGVIIPIVLAFVFSLFLRLFARIIVYSLIVICVCFMMALSLWCAPRDIGFGP